MVDDIGLEFEEAKNNVIEDEEAEAPSSHEKSAGEEQLHQLRFDLFSIHAARVSSELVGTQKKALEKLLDPILEYFESDEWQNISW